MSGSNNLDTNKTSPRNPLRLFSPSHKPGNYPMRIALCRFRWPFRTFWLVMFQWATVTSISEFHVQQYTLFSPTHCLCLVVNVFSI